MHHNCRKPAAQGRQEGPHPEIPQRRALQDATLVSGVWGRSRSRGLQRRPPTAPHTASVPT